MNILGIDLGTTSTASAATLLDTESGEILRRSFPTQPSEFIKQLKDMRPLRVVVEPTPITGAIVDICRAMNIEIVVANPRDDAWKNRTAKTDKHDADLLAKLSATGQLRTVHIPDRDVREWRSLINFRQHIIRARTRIKNHIKALLRNEFIHTSHLWNKDGFTALNVLAKPLSLCDPDETWRGQLHVEIQRYREGQRHLKDIEARLDALGKKSGNMTILLDIDGVGHRCAEALVAFIDRPGRFANRKDIAAYFGLCPHVEQSGDHCAYGRITKAGNRTVRALLTEIAWLGIRRDPWMRSIFDAVLRKDPRRRKRAVVAVARRLLVKCWAKLRDFERNPSPTQCASPSIMTAA